MEYLPPQGALLPLVYGTTASALWNELRGLSAWQRTPSWTVYRLACQRLPPWLQVTFAIVPDAAWPGSDQRPWATAPAASPVGRLGRPSAPDPWVVGSFLSLGRPTCARVCGVLGHLAPVHRCARLVRCFAFAVSWATWLLFTGVPARCVALLERSPGPLGSCSPLCPLRVLLWVCGVLGHLAPVHQCARLVRCFACAESWATRLLFTGVPPRHVVLHVGCPGPLGSCSPVCTLGGLLCVCGVLGHLASVHRCARSMCCLCVRCPGPLGSCSTVCPLGVLCCVCGVLGHLTPVHQCAGSVPCFACAVSWATWLLFTSLPARSVACVCVVLRQVAPVHRYARWVCCLCVRCPRPLCSCSPVRPLGALLCVCGVLNYLASVHRCARSVCCFACAVSWATWLPFTGVPARCVACVCGVLGHLAPVHQCAHWVRCLCVRCPGPPGSCSPVCPLCEMPVWAASWATWLPFTGVPAWCVVLVLRCPGPRGSCSPVCPLGVLRCVCGVLGHLAAVHRCARSVCCAACAVSWAPWLLFTDALAQCAVLCPGPLGYYSPVCVVLQVTCAGRRCGALICPSGQWLFVVGRGWVPSRRAIVHSDGGCS